MTKQKEAPPTIITLTLPPPEGDGSLPEEVSATLLIQRGELAQVRQFVYTSVRGLGDQVAVALAALKQIEAAPPVIPNLPEAKPKPEPKKKAKVAAEPVVDEEPTIDIPLQKGTKAVRISHLKLTGGETDAAAYRQVVLIAGKLIDGKLWDGESPIRIDDVYALEKRMKYLTAKDLSLFALEDFVQVGATADASETVQSAGEDAVEADGSGTEGELLQTAAPSAFNANGHHPDDAAAE